MKFIKPEDVAAWRNGRRLTINRAAACMDSNRSTVVNLEHGHKPIRRIHALALIALDQIMGASNQRPTDDQIMGAFREMLGRSGIDGPYKAALGMVDDGLGEFYKPRKTRVRSTPKAKKSPVRDRRKAKKPTYGRKVKK